MSGDVARVIEDALRSLPSALDPFDRTRALLARLRFPTNIGLIAIGKASRPMTRAAVDVLGDRVVHGVVVDLDAAPLPPFEVHAGSHPLPDATSEAAGRAVLAMAERTDHDHLLVLVSGGGSAMAEVPKRPLDIGTVASIVDRMMAAATPIEEMNVVRRHLSQVKHGGVSGRSKAPVTTLAISDVVDGPASTVASGPTLHDDSTALDALGIIERRLGRPVPQSVHTALATPVPRRRNEEVHVVADRHTAYAVMSRRLAEAGLGESRAIRLEGDAAAMASAIVAMPGLTIGTGETTVTVSGGGKGGRNQHAALAAAIEIDGLGRVFGTFGTDGIDGPTDAAGAVVDGSTYQRLRSAGVSPEDSLARCDSHPALEAAGCLIRTGPTGTNVADVWVSYVPATT